ncbi:hypothetical protein M0R45_005283 [Rubus argutus]|uniref:Uncharacterized protein n=1 Tax=Rubus argutus TaxID=59490 RepID=A0AAW1YMF2_RUBAR
MNIYVPNLDKGKGLYFLFIKAETKTPGGLVARPVLTSYYKRRALQDQAVRPLQCLHQPQRGHSLLRLVPEHVHPNALRPPHAQTSPPRRRCLRLRPSPSHPVPPAQLATTST